MQKHRCTNICVLLRCGTILHDIIDCDNTSLISGRSARRDDTWENSDTWTCSGQILVAVGLVSLAACISPRRVLGLQRCSTFAHAFQGRDFRHVQMWVSFPTQYSEIELSTLHAYCSSSNLDPYVPLEVVSILLRIRGISGVSLSIACQIIRTCKISFRLRISVFHSGT